MADIETTALPLMNAQELSNAHLIGLVGDQVKRAKASDVGGGGGGGPSDKIQKQLPAAEGVADLMLVEALPGLANSAGGDDGIGHYQGYQTTLQTNGPPGHANYYDTVFCDMLNAQPVNYRAVNRGLSSYGRRIESKFANPGQPFASEHHTVIAHMIDGAADHEFRVQSFYVPHHYADREGSNMSIRVATQYHMDAVNNMRIKFDFAPAQTTITLAETPLAPAARIHHDSNDKPVIRQKNTAGDYLDHPYITASNALKLSQALFHQGNMVENPVGGRIGVYHYLGGVQDGDSVMSVQFADLNGGTLEGISTIGRVQGGKLLSTVYNYGGDAVFEARSYAATGVPMLSLHNNIRGKGWTLGMSDDDTVHLAYGVRDVSTPVLSATSALVRAERPLGLKAYTAADRPATAQAGAMIFNSTSGLPEIWTTAWTPMVAPLPTLGITDWGYEENYPSATTANFFTGAAISAGTFAGASSTWPNDGRVIGGMTASSSATANSGYRHLSNTGFLMFGGGQAYKFQALFRLQNITTETIRIGFHDATTNADAVDGCYFEIVGASIAAKTSKASARTLVPGPTNLTLTLYAVDIEIDAAATSARFRLFNALTGAVLFDTTITANMPNTVNNVMGAGWVATSSGTAVAPLLTMHRMFAGSLNYFNRVRGSNS